MKCASFKKISACAAALAACASAFGFADIAAPAEAKQAAAQPAKAAPAAGGAAGANAAPSGGIFESATSERFADRIFDPKSDSIDFEKGTFTWKGKSFDIGNSRAVRARFERYLSLPAAGASFENYQAIISVIESNLAASNDRLDYARLRPVWLRLFDAAEYDADGGACITIANLVYTSWRMRNEVETSSLSIKEMEREKELAQRLATASATKLEYEQHLASGRRARSMGGPGTLQGKTALAEKIKRIQEQTAALAAAEAAKGVLGAKAVLQFQTQIMIFMMERKFQQAQIASMFYRHIYRGSVQDFKSGVKELFSSLGSASMIPTIDSVEAIANDARKDIRDGMSAVENLYAMNERYSAMTRLLETFVLGENDPTLISFDVKKRRELLKIYRALSTMRELAESRDWAAMESCAAEMGALAADFPSKEIMAKVNAAKRASSMHVMAARQAAFAGDIQKARESLAEAAKLWPTNPEIEKFSGEAMSAALGASKYSEKFDDAVKAKNYRAIAAEAPEYTMALRGDEKKLKQLKKIVEDIAKIDFLIAQAREMSRQNNSYLAWDVLENARGVEPNDPVLANERARLAPEAADYVKLLNKAKKEEQAGRYAAALNCYLAAKKLSPASSQCSAGIERLSGRFAD